LGGFSELQTPIDLASRHGDLHCRENDEELERERFGIGQFPAADALPTTGQ
jgi:hypothetical protein